LSIRVISAFGSSVILHKEEQRGSVLGFEDTNENIKNRPISKTVSIIIVELIAINPRMVFGSNGWNGSAVQDWKDFSVLEEFIRLFPEKAMVL